MKAVIVELNKNRAAALSDDGIIVNIKNNNYEVGQVIQMSSNKTSIVKKLTVFAASAAAFIILGTGTWAYASPYSYVSLDVNPSIEFIINRFDRVIKVKAVNDDGEEILSEISLDDLTNETIKDAIKTTVDQISDAGYFDGDTEGGIVIAASSEDTEKADELALELQDFVEQETTDNGDSVVVEAYSVGMERVEEARDLGVTPGKLNLVEKLQEAAGETSEVNKDEWLNKSVKDIMKATKDYKKASKGNEEGTGQSMEDAEETGAEVAAEQQQNQGKDSQLSEKEDKQQRKDDEKAIKDAEKDAEKAQKDAAKEENKSAKDNKKGKNEQESADITEEENTITSAPTITPAIQADKELKNPDKPKVKDDKKENNPSKNESKKNDGDSENNGNSASKDNPTTEPNVTSSEVTQDSNHTGIDNGQDSNDITDKGNQDSNGNDSSKDQNTKNNDQNNENSNGQGSDNSDKSNPGNGNK